MLPSYFKVFVDSNNTVLLGDDLILHVHISLCYPTPMIVLNIGITFSSKLQYFLIERLLLLAVAHISPCYPASADCVQCWYCIDFHNTVVMLVEGPVLIV